MNPYDPTLDLRDYKYPAYTLTKDSPLAPLLKSLLERNKTQQLQVIWSINSAECVFKDFVQLKNIIVVGPPGIGKSTFIHQLLFSILAIQHPSLVKLVLFDCKGIEFNTYGTIEKHFLAKLPGAEDAVVTKGKNIIATLNSLCIEMDNRFDLLKDGQCRNITEYNDKFVNLKLSPEKGHQYLPFLIIAIDELADLIIWGENKIYNPLQKLVMNGYKVGIFNIVSTNQYIGNTLPSNMFSGVDHRVVFRLNDKDDYRRFLDTVRIEHILRCGDFVYLEEGKIQKGKTLQLEYEFIDKIVDFIGRQRGYAQAFLLPEYVDAKEIEGHDFDVTDKDPLFEDAARLMVGSQSGSTSLLQRRMKLGYNRAGRIMDQLEAAGIVGPNRGDKTRDVLIKSDAELQIWLDSLG